MTKKLTSADMVVLVHLPQSREEGIQWEDALHEVMLILEGSVSQSQQTWDAYNLLKAIARDLRMSKAEWDA